MLTVGHAALAVVIGIGCFAFPKAGLAVSLIAVALACLRLSRPEVETIDDATGEGD
jgi:hypothetical protein